MALLIFFFDTSVVECTSEKLNINNENEIILANFAKTCKNWQLFQRLVVSLQMESYLMSYDGIAT